MERRHIQCDRDKCTGCMICEFACSAAKEGRFDLELSRIRVLRATPTQLDVVACLSCRSTPCVKECPRGALSVDEATQTISLDKARCAGCGAPIPARYPLVEAAGGALAVLSVLRFGFTLDAAFAYAFLMALLAVTLIDWDFRIIPDRISIPFIAAGLVWSLMSPRLSLAGSALGALVGGGALLAVGELYRLARKVEGMGGGDVKLMAMIGAFLGVRLILPVILVAAFAGSIYGLALMKRGHGGKTAVAFGSFLAPAAAVCLFVGEALVSWYLGGL